MRFWESDMKPELWEDDMVVEQETTNIFICPNCNYGSTNAISFNKRRCYTFHEEYECPNCKMILRLL